MESTSILLSFLRFALNGSPIDTHTATQLTPEILSDTYTLAQNHDLAHMAAYAMKALKLGQETPVWKDFDHRQMEAVYRYIQLNHEYQQICHVLQEQGIPFLPLKGSVIRALYPQPWMRTSCDIDILVKEDTLQAAISALSDKLKYQEGKKENHDISLHSPSGIHLELHFRMLQEQFMVNACDRVLERVWQEAQPAEASPCQYGMSDPMFYFYHIAHMAKHVGTGGCGIRPFMDLWLLNHKLPHDRAAREALLEEGRLLTFAKVAEQVAEVWFSQAEHSPLSRQLEAYILKGNSYGSLENLASFRQAQSGGKFKYYVNRIFMPYRELKAYYPILKKHKWLMPFCQLARWLRILFTGRAKLAAAQLSAADTADHCAELLERLEIM